MKVKRLYDNHGHLAYQVVWLGRLKKGVKFFQSSITGEGCRIVRYGPLVVTDCVHVDWETGEEISND